MSSSIKVDFRLDRRNFMRLLAGAGLSANLPLALWPNMGFATQPRTNKKFFVSINLSGGWDVLLASDTRLDAEKSSSGLLDGDKPIFFGYTDADLIQVGDLYLGPAMQGLSKYLNEISIVNGVFISEADNGHDAASSYMLRGSVDNSYGEIAGELSLARQDLLGAGVFGGRGIVRVSESSVVDSLKLDTINGDRLSRSIELTSSYVLEDSPIGVEVLGLGKHLDLVKEFEAELKNTSYSDQWLNVLVNTFRFNLTSTATIELGGDLDTHTNHERTHKTALEEMFTRISGVFDAFKATPYGADGSSLFDNTVFMITSDFTRTPALNGEKGKDHNPQTNSVILAGAGVKPGQMVGRSRLVTLAESTMGIPYHVAQPVDLRQGGQVIDPNGTVIYPETVVATIYDILGFDRSKLGGRMASVGSLKSLLGS